MGTAESDWPAAKAAEEVEYDVDGHKERLGRNEASAGTVRYHIAMARKRLAELLRLDERLGTKGRT